MEKLSEMQRETFERIVWEMSSNIEIIEYHLDWLNESNDPFLNNFKQRLIGIVNAIDECKLNTLDCTS